VVFPQVDQLPRHPVQLYEAAFHTVAAVLLGAALQRQWCRGQLIKIYVVVYAGWRFLTEFIRPEIRLVAGLTWYQWASVVLMAGFGWLWYHDTRKR
jgi:prolipoprotein diacylglyceryltransferase